MAEPVRAWWLTDQEGERLQQIVRARASTVDLGAPAMIIMASASGTLVPAIARLVAADEDTARDVIHALNAKGWPRWTLGGREAVPASSVTRPSRPSSRRPGPGGEAGPAIHPVEPAQAGRLFS